MAQIIDMEERRKPRSAPRGRSESPVEPSMLDPFVMVDQLALPVFAIWQSWFATWGSLWLAPFGLQVSAVEAVPRIEPKDRAGPRA